MYNNKNQRFGIKFIILISLLFILLFKSNAQFESSKWIFGHGAGIDFKGGEVQSFTGSKINTIEGCSTLSNNKGDLLFYTDGISVWNKNNALMPNGKDLKGNISSTQSTIIIPKPGSKTILYVFTVDSEGGKGGFTYSIVDLSKEKGLGDITVKNEPINIHFTEKLIAVKHPNNVDIWVIVHEYESNVFLVYLLTKNGLSPQPIISTIGMKHDKSIYNTIGYMKMSPDKKKLALAINGNKIVQLFDFNAKDGTITNPITLKFDAQSSPYGLEFSPNSNLLYISMVSNGFVYQAIIDDGNEQSIQKSIRLIGRSKKNRFLGALQLGIDGRIYAAEYQSKYLSVIDNPNTIGSSCSYRAEAVTLNGGICMLGLPTFVQDFITISNSAQKAQRTDKIMSSETNKKHILNNVYFDLNESVLQNTYVSELQQLADLLNKNKRLNTEIIGHTDSTGSIQYNNKLSLARAKVIRNYLIDKGIETSRITFSGKGSSEPVASNKDEAGRQKNRRVEFVFKAIPINKSNTNSQ
jgi:outer membrane protein OmpA-like peptidoglycan-associated protein/6-phosphogluconolactonase (cycloisomerase 2 family)